MHLSLGGFLTAAVTLLAGLTEIAHGQVKTVGHQFSLNGQAHYYAGVNAYYLSQTTNGTAVDAIMGELAASNASVVRVWGFSDDSSKAVYFQEFGPTATFGVNGTRLNEGNNGIGVLDYVVRSAEQHGLQLMLPLINGNPDYGGMFAYCANFDCGTPGPDNWPNGFYTSQGAQAAFLNWTETVVNRYKASPAIFAWELTNEARCKGCDTKVITNWASSVSAHIKTLDPAHMVALGDEGYICNATEPDSSYAYQCTNGVNFTQNMAVPTLDFGTFHCYPDAWSEPSYDFCNKWIIQHDQIAFNLNKPCVLTEYGTPNNQYVTDELQWQQTIVESTSAVGMDMYWQFGDPVNDPGNYDGYSVNITEPYYVQIATQHANNMSAKALT